MKTEEAAKALDALPPNARQIVIKLINLLHERYKEEAGPKKEELPPLREDPFFGMWRDREDMADSSAWVRELRKRELG